MSTFRVTERSIRTAVPWPRILRTGSGYLVTKLIRDIDFPRDPTENVLKDNQLKQHEFRFLIFELKREFYC